MIQKTLFIGLMSGTSMDAVDAVIASFTPSIKLIGTLTIPITKKIKVNLNTLLQEKNISLQLLGETDVALGKLFADAVMQLLAKANISAEKIAAIGSPGQTIFHAPTGEFPFTLQIGDPNIIATQTGITTIADFRRKDMALGGQGAPLAPAFHAYLFPRQAYDQWILNIGGIANLTLIPADTEKTVIGFDTGPGNTLLDLWCEKHTGKSYDQDGAWAKNGKCNDNLLGALLADPYFQKPHPKSTGREYFNLRWLENFIHKGDTAENIQHTLTELTAQSIAIAIKNITQQHKLRDVTRDRIFICGGGAYNTYLIEKLRTHCPQHDIATTDTIGIAPTWIEAATFAWLAKQTLEQKAGNLASVTGARKQGVLGGVYSHE
ncbi:MAG: anhydro-N-acetylmuramic acid kinase [Gammaproteobacteria bacterium RIFCSPHIGHO2_12_FULL_38_14]|nr:MAG: anhydro-N-acetylmuramic acid kinase [Gammaproteobacteria bacterium RIFCSPHIGHO2_12_FULL_38_14]